MAGPVDRTVGSSPNLAVFDVDGTLTDSHEVDSSCYRAALVDVFGPEALEGELRWSDFPQVTDAAIIRTLVRRRMGRELRERELESFEAAFVERVGSALASDPSLCRPVSGAVEFLDSLAASGRWRFALATGGFRRSALLKLLHAGFLPPEVLCSSEDAPSREGIVRRAVACARAAEGSEFRSIVALGDGVWDVAAAVELGVPCVGVGRGERAGDLSAAGAFAVLTNYSNPEEALAILDRAAAESSPSDLAG